MALPINHRSIMNHHLKGLTMNSFEQLMDNHPEFDGLLEMKPSYEMPLWLSREADFEQPEPVADNLVPLDFDSC